jgi:hypothetical protein
MGFEDEYEYEYEDEFEEEYEEEYEAGGHGLQNVFSESEEMELASELLTIADDEELEYFLGNWMAVSLVNGLIRFRFKPIR